MKYMYSKVAQEIFLLLVFFNKKAASPLLKCLIGEVAIRFHLLIQSQCAISSLHIQEKIELRIRIGE